MEIVYALGDCYQMGDTFGDGGSCENPVHEVSVDVLYTGRYKVTKCEWWKVTGGNPSHFLKGDRYPVERVSWQDIRSFINQLSSRSGQSYHLSTGAKWKNVVRERGKRVLFGIGRDTTGPYGANFDGRLKYKGNYSHGGAYRREPVGWQFRPNSLNLYDMRGNVSEWCHDWYESSYYGKSPSRNPEGPSSACLPSSTVIGQMLACLCREDHRVAG